MSDISCIIVEDEPLAAKVLSDYILATEYLRDNTVGLIFLDIHLPKLKGMAFLKTLPNPPDVIITTAYHQYAVEGFNLNVTDYLLKPFDFERFLNAVNKVKSAKPEKTEPVETSEVKEYLFLNVQKKKMKILFSEIVYIESQREYIKIVTTKSEYTTKMSTHEIESLLPPALFKRIHRSFIVALKKIDSYTAETVDVNGVSIPIGKGYREVLDRL
jgi:DNA-binding LytR/AlgR family response regulator